VRFARSLDGGRHFDEPLTVNDDHAPISHRFDAMARDGRGRIYLTWLDKRDLSAAQAGGTDYAGAAVYYAVSEDNGASFTANRRLVDHSCECCRIAVDVDPDDRLVVLWRHVFPVDLRDHAIARLDSDAATTDVRPVRATDDGWRIDGCPHHGPDLSLSKLAGQAHRAHITWFTQGDKNRGLYYGRYDLDRGHLEIQQT
ncbi:MAG: exo-alpha-sialidase, partial [Rhodocyclaceae bacterium]|nr:exo-alpha-sialidase [Rhodocyclaceae bacterium]